MKGGRNKTTYVGQLKAILLNGWGRYFRFTEESADAVELAYWAADVLSCPNVCYLNGRDSHEAALDVLESAENTLINYMLLVTRSPYLLPA